MPYENIYCHICEGLIRTEEVPGTESPKIPSETHDHLEDCVKELVHQMDYINVRLLKLEGR